VPNRYKNVREQLANIIRNEQLAGEVQEEAEMCGGCRRHIQMCEYCTITTNVSCARNVIKGTGGSNEDGQT
jgi:hypothetical protein